MFHARHSDLVVVGRRHSSDLMPYDLIEWLVVGSGRPVLIAPDSAVTQVTAPWSWVGRKPPRRRMRSPLRCRC